MNKTLSFEKSNASIPIAAYLNQQNKSNEIEEDEQEIDEDENQNLIIVDENQEEEEEEDDNDVEQVSLPKHNHSRLQNGNLRCRQCDYEADDLSDLLIHRKAHASMKYTHEEKTSNNNSDIENDDDEKEKNQDLLFDQQTFDYGL